MGKGTTTKAEPFPEEGTAEEAAMRAEATLKASASQAERKVELVTAGGSKQVANLNDLKDMDLAAIMAAFPDATDATEAIGTDQYGPILEDKTQLVGKPFVLVHWNFYSGEFGEFVSAWIMTNDNAKFIVNDGSSGIYQQLRNLTDNTGQDSMLVCRKGLRVSEYEKELPKSGGGTVMVQAKTYYIDTKL